jgi:hypothetical protein
MWLSTLDIIIDQFAISVLALLPQIGLVDMIKLAIATQQYPNPLNLKKILP